MPSTLNLFQFIKVINSLFVTLFGCFGALSHIPESAGTHTCVAAEEGAEM